MVDYYNLGIECIKGWLSELMEEVEGVDKEKQFEELHCLTEYDLIKQLGFYYEVSLK